MPDNQMTPPGGMPGGMGTSQDDAQEQTTDSVVICIEMKTDGTFMVGPEAEGGGKDDANMQPAGSVDEALIGKSLPDLSQVEGPGDNGQHLVHNTIENIIVDTKS